MFLFPFFSCCSHSAKHVIKTRKVSLYFLSPSPRGLTSQAAGHSSPWADQLSPSARLRCLPRPSVTGVALNPGQEPLWEHGWRQEIPSVDSRASAAGALSRGSARGREHSALGLCAPFVL